MRVKSVIFALFALLIALGTLGCAHRYPPPPPAAYAPGPLARLADHNGFETGRVDGSRDAREGRPPRPQRTHAFRDTPGYDPQLGPLRVYRDAFRNAYLRGYDRGYHRG